MYCPNQALAPCQGGQWLLLWPWESSLPSPCFGPVNAAFRHRCCGLHPSRAQVDRQDHIFNVYLGPDGRPRRVQVGDLRDLGTVKVADFGGIPVSSLQSAARQRRRTITAFPDPDAGSVVLPPNTPFTRGPVRPCFLGTRT